MAEQREPVRRKVALKVIKLGMDTRQVIARFEAERQALALMDHPNIAKVLDAGATETGRPYFVMELVKGVPITEYCDTESLTTGERLRLFMRVCHAVQHAHQKGIIHRDLKPSNVLVTLHDGEPVPKVIDFGIAKATNRELTDKTLFTEFRQFMGTPEYMSPEQAEMSGLDIDTRSDIYSLGVLLYELLTGVTPFDGKRLRSAALAEIQRIIREEEPPRPSTRLSGGRATPGPGRETGGPAESEQSSVHYITKHRRTDPRSLTRQLRGDLDWIVMKCLEKDRSRRYETANGLALDIERHLSDEPVMATPPSRVYRLRKLARRNRSVCTAAAVVFLTLALGVVGTTAGMLRAMDAEARVGRELVRTREVKRLLSDMIGSVDPSIAQSSDTTLLRRIVDDTAARLDREDIQDPFVLIDMHAWIGQAYRLIGLFEAAEKHLLSALEESTRALGTIHLTTLSIEHEIGVLRLVQSRYREADSILADLRDRYSGIRGPHAAEMHVKVAADLATALVGLGRYDAAERAYLDGLSAAGRVHGADEAYRLTLTSNLAQMYLNTGRTADAGRLLSGLVERARAALGPEHPVTITCLANSAALCLREGRLEDADRLYAEAAATAHRVLGPGCRETIALRCDRATLLQRRGRMADAEAEFQQSLRDATESLGPEHELTLRCMTSLAHLELVTGRARDAIEMGERILTIRRRTQGDHAPATLGDMTNLAMAYNGAGEFEKAGALLEESLALKRRVLPAGHPWTLMAIEELVKSYTALGHIDEALPLCRELLEARTTAADQPGADASLLNQAAWTLLTHDAQELRDPARALGYALRACEAQESASAGNLWMYLDTLALAQHSTGDSAAAVETQRRALSLMPEGADPEMPERLAQYEAALAGQGEPVNAGDDR